MILLRCFPLLLALIYFVEFSNGLDSINLLGVYIEWENQGSQTEFHATSDLSQISDPSDAWLAIGVNTENKMVFLIFIIIIEIYNSLYSKN